MTALILAFLVASAPAPQPSVAELEATANAQIAADAAWFAPGPWEDGGVLRELRQHGIRRAMGFSLGSTGAMAVGGFGLYAGVSTLTARYQLGCGYYGPCTTSSSIEIMKGFGYVLSVLGGAAVVVAIVLAIVAIHQLASLTWGPSSGPEGDLSGTPPVSAVFPVPSLLPALPALSLQLTVARF